MSPLRLTSNPHQERVQLSKRLTYHLRHGGNDSGVPLDQQGWADLDLLLQTPQFKMVIIINPEM